MPCAPCLLCGMGHPGELHSSPPQLGAGFGPRPFSASEVGFRGLRLGRGRGRLPRLFTFDLRRQAIGHGGKPRAPISAPSSGMGLGCDMKQGHRRRVGSLGTTKAPPDSWTLDSEVRTPRAVLRAGGKGVSHCIRDADSLGSGSQKAGGT